jgi:YCII-related domain
MPTFVFAYRASGSYNSTPESASAWKAWFDGMGDDVVDLGKPAVGAATVGNCGPGTALGGYSVISAPDLDAALAVAKGCPQLNRDGGVEVAELVDVPAALSTGQQAG